jgi:uncharacterized protein YjiS (DUF1127 family)
VFDRATAAPKAFSEPELKMLEGRSREVNFRLASRLLEFFSATGAKENSHGHHRVAATQPFGTPIAGNGLAGVVTRMVARVAAAVADELRIRRDMRQLRAMDDHMLKDIGLTRADIGSAVRCGRD